MLCEKCKKNQANTTITENINGHVTVRHLCGECASKAGIGVVGGIFGGMLGGMFSELVSSKPVRKCRVCGCSFSDFTRTGKAGCPNCYAEFYPELLPTLQKLHGKTGHVGKTPRTVVKAGPVQESTAEPDTKQRIYELKKQLAKAVEAEEFENAAKLRDEIKSLEE